MIKSVWVSGIINTLASATQTAAAEAFGYFFALVLDTQANGATIVSENVYLNPSTTTTAILPQPLRNLQQSTRFKILASRYYKPGGIYAFNDGTATGSSNAQVAPRVTLSWKGSINVDTTGTTADVASVADNAIHLIAYSGGGLTANFQGKSRMRFMG